MDIKVNFIYQKRVIEIQSKIEDELNTIYQRFLIKLNPNLSKDDFDFFYEGNKLDKDIKKLKKLFL